MRLAKNLVAVLGLAVIATAVAAAASAGGPPISEVQSIALDPVHHGTIYVGVYSGPIAGGVYKSTNGGGSWTLLNADSNVTVDVRVVAVDPITPTTVYAGSTYTGIFKSLDGGTTWNPINSGLGALPSVQSLAIDPINPLTLYTCVIGGVFKSTDGGANWSAANSGLTSADVLGVTIQPGNSTTLYARVNGGGVFKSTNSAASWTSVNTGLASLYVYSLAINPANPTTLYAGTYDMGVFKSVDGGATWAAVNTGLTDLHMGTSLVLDPVNPNNVYATGKAGVWKSVDGGANWKSASVGLEASVGFSNAAFNALVVDPSSSNTLYLGGVPGGFYKSVNGAATWFAADNGLSTNPVVLGVAVELANPANVYAGTLWGAGLSLGGVFKSPNGGAGWTALTFGLNQLQSLAIDPSSPTTIYAGPIVSTVGFLSGGGVIKSTNSGATWSAANIGLPTISGMANGSTTTTTAGINGFAVDPSFPQTVYGAPGTTIYKSTDGGGHWVAAGAGLPGSTTSIDSIAVDPSNATIVYAGTSAGTVWKSLDGAASWNAVSTNLPNVAIQALAVNPGRPSNVYAGTDTKGVFISRDSGATWAPSNSGLPNLAVLSLAVDPAVSNTIYGGTNGGGVFKSTDGGSNWQAVGNNTGNGAGPATVISKVGGDAQSGPVGHTLVTPMTVLLTNSAIPVAGVPVTFAASGGGSLSAISAVTDSQGVASTTLTLGVNVGPNTVTASATGLAPVLFSATGTNGASGMTVTSVGNAASFTQSFAPGMLMSIFGTSLSFGSPQIVSTAPLPLMAASGTSVTINGIAAPLLYISPTQINLQIPYEVTPGSAKLVVSNGGQSASANFTIASAGPGIFVDYRNGNVVPSESAPGGSAIAFFVTGAGLATPAEATGNVPSAGTTPVPNLPVVVTIGGIPVTPAYLGIPSWSVGVLQINVPVPASLAGTVAELIVSIGGVQSKPALLAVTP